MQRNCGSCILHRLDGARENADKAAMSAIRTRAVNFCCGIIVTTPA
jgi:hypothetical protein